MHNVKRSLALLLLFLLLCTMSYGQSFLPLDWRQGAYFHGNIYNSPPPGNASSFHDADTIMCGQVWDRICQSRIHLTLPVCVEYYVRQQNGQIILSQYCTGTDQLLFDFSLQVGDTADINQGICHAGKYLVDSASMRMLLNGSLRKHMVLHGISPWNQGDTLHWIEGVGDAVLGMAPMCDFEGGRVELVCQKEGGVKVYENPAGLQLGNCDTLLGVLPLGMEPSMPSMDVTVSPLPCRDRLRITVEGAGPCHVEVWDLLGRSSIRQRFWGECALEVGHLEEGVYLYLVTDETSGTMRSGRLVKQ